MCESCCGGAVVPDEPQRPHLAGAAAPAPLSRRALLAGGAVAAGAVALGVGLGARPAAAATVALGSAQVRPRSEWGADRPPKGPLPSDPDVRFLLVHHTADPGNDYTAAQVPGLLRGIYAFHTKAKDDGGKGWNDVAYSFFVDRFGGIWEGRAGSLAGPVVCDETGGNQGFARFCCFLGNHTEQAPTPAALDAMARLLGALADLHQVSLAEGAMTTFTSKGSPRFPEGQEATVRTLSGHRDVSITACPGDACYPLLAGDLRTRAAAATGSPPPAAVATTTTRRARSAPATSPPFRPGTVPPATSAPALPAPTAPGPAVLSPAPLALDPTTIPSTTTASTLLSGGEARRVTIRDGVATGGRGVNPLLFAAAGAGGVLALSGAVWDVRRRLALRSADRGWKRPGQEAEEQVGVLWADGDMEPDPARPPSGTRGAGGWVTPPSTSPDAPAWEAPDDGAADRWLEGDDPRR